MSTYHFLTKALYSNLYTAPCDYDNPQSLGCWFRRRRARQIIELLEQCYKRYQRVDILDIGGRANYWNIIPQALFHRFKLSITLVNDDKELTTGNSHQADKAFFTELTGDGCNLQQFPDNSFHLVHCNSVIEHVGNWKNMQALASEITRLAPCYYVQTPSFWFPVEPHFLTLFYHWLPEPVRVSLLLKCSLGHMSRQRSVSNATQVVQSVNLLDKKMLQALFPDTKIVTERFLLLEKSISAVRGISD